MTAKAAKISSRHAAATSLQASPSRAVLYWATLGVLIVLFQAYVWGSWVTGADFRPTDPGPDPIPLGLLRFYTAIQILVPVVSLGFFWVYLIRPWIREGRMTTDGRLIIAAFFVYFWDPNMNYNSTVLFYNSYMINFGSWTAGSWPGWLSPNGNLLPEPVVLGFFGYVALAFSQVIFTLWLLRRAKQRWPNLGVAAVLAIIVVGLTIVDTCVEIIFIRTQVWAYPGVISALSLWPGKWYQFPLTEAFFFGGIGFGSFAVLSYFRDDRGQTFAERGIDSIRYGERSKQILRFFAVYGFTHTMFFLGYMVPHQWISLHSDTFPQGYPSYLVNNMCVYGPENNQCPGPGVQMPRPLNNFKTYP